MTKETDCGGTPEGVGLKVEALPFERIPGQSRIFLDYLRDPTHLRRFYPSAVRFHHETGARAKEVLDNYTTSRDAVCDALAAMNTGWGAGAEVLRSVERLRSTRSVAVVSGQQVGLFTGPLYTIYKALSAVKLARCLAERGTEAVAVFWMATEDHDWPEVQAADTIACDGRLARVEVPDALHTDGQPVGGVVLDESIEETVTRLLSVLPTSEFTPDLEELLRTSYRPGRTHGEAFARMMTGLTARYGLVLLDPTDARLKRLAAPLYAEAARRAQEIAQALVERSRALDAEGYHAQVHTSEDAFPLFLHDERGARHALARNAEGLYQVKGSAEALTAEGLASLAAREPERFSPNVTLRAVVQDFLLPTVAYFGGAAEVAYFAQTAEVYRVLGRPVTPILHRASMTIVERRPGRALARYGLTVEEFFAGLDPVIARVVEEHLGRDVAQTFAQTEQKIAAALEELGARLRKFDPTLGDALASGRRKIFYQLEGMRSRFHRAQMARDRAVLRQLERAATAIYPEKSLQERHINVTSLLARHGRYVTDWIFSAIDPGTVDHLVVYL